TWARTGSVFGRGAWERGGGREEPGHGGEAERFTRRGPGLGWAFPSAPPPPAVRGLGSTATLIFAGYVGSAGERGDTCSWIACRSLLSCGWSWRYGPVRNWADSSALKRS